MQKVSSWVAITTTDKITQCHITATKMKNRMKKAKRTEKFLLKNFRFHIFGRYVEYMCTEWSKCIVYEHCFSWLWIFIIRNIILQNEYVIIFKVSFPGNLYDFFYYTNIILNNYNILRMSAEVETTSEDTNNLIIWRWHDE